MARFGPPPSPSRLRDRRLQFHVFAHPSPRPAGQGDWRHRLQLHSLAMRLILYSFIAAAALCLTVAGQEADPVMKGSAKYTMPQSAMDAEMGGQVVLAVRVDETGKV